MDGEEHCPSPAPLYRGKGPPPEPKSDLSGQTTHTRLGWETRIAISDPEMATDASLNEKGVIDNCVVSLYSDHINQVAYLDRIIL